MKITLYKKYLFHDIDQWTYRLANVRMEDAIKRDEAQSTQTRDTDLTFYIRKIHDGVAHLRVHLTEELVNSTDDSTDVISTSTESWQFQFKEDTSITADSKACADLMHRFVLWHVIKDWAMAYAPDAVSTAAANLQEAMEALDEGLYSLELPIKHRRPIYKEETEITVA